MTGHCEPLSPACAAMALCRLGAQRSREVTLSQALPFIPSGGIDDALMASLRASLTQLEKIARAGLVDEDMPRCVQGIAERQFDEFWIHFREYIEDEVPPPSPPPPSATSTSTLTATIVTTTFVPSRSTRTNRSSAPATARASPPPHGPRRARAGPMAAAAAPRRGAGSAPSCSTASAQPTRPSGRSSPYTDLFL